MVELAPIYEQRSNFSKGRLKELGEKIAEIPTIPELNSLTIFGAGSYGRCEASEYSDIDLFFLCEEIREVH